MFEPRYDRFAERVRASFERQNFMHTLGAHVTAVEPGFVEIRLTYDVALCQQHGYFHGGVIGTLIGSLIMGSLANGMNLLDVSAFWQRVIEGAVIVAVVIVDQWRRRRFGR